MYPYSFDSISWPFCGVKTVAGNGGRVSRERRGAVCRPVVGHTVGCSRRNLDLGLDGIYALEGKRTHSVCCLQDKTESFDFCYKCSCHISHGPKRTQNGCQSDQHNESFD